MRPTHESFLEIANKMKTENQDKKQIFLINFTPTIYKFINVISKYDKELQSP